MLSGFNNREWRMNVGKTLFAQGMEFRPWKTIGRILERHKNGAEVRMPGVLTRLFFTHFPEWDEARPTLLAHQAKELPITATGFDLFAIARAQRNGAALCGLCAGAGAR